MFNLKHKRDRFLLANRAGVLSFESSRDALLYLNEHGYAGQYEVVSA